MVNDGAPKCDCVDYFSSLIIDHARSLRTPLHSCPKVVPAMNLQLLLLHIDQGSVHPASYTTGAEYYVSHFPKKSQTIIFSLISLMIRNIYSLIPEKASLSNNFRRQRVSCHLGMRYIIQKRIADTLFSRVVVLRDQTLARFPAYEYR